MYEKAIESATTPITVVIADDHEVTRMGLRDLLRAAPDLELVGEAADGDAAQRLIAQLQPRVAVLDLVMPGASPAAIMLWAAQYHPETAVLVLTAHDRDYYLSRMLNAGAVGYLDKNARGEALLDAIRRAAGGQILFTQEQRRRVQDWRENVQAVWEGLTPREREVLTWLCRGQSNAQIALTLNISAHTVETHMGNLLRKLGVESRSAAILWVMQNGTMEDSSISGGNPPEKNSGFPG